MKPPSWARGFVRVPIRLRGFSRTDTWFYETLEEAQRRAQVVADQKGEPIQWGEVTMGVLKPLGWAQPRKEVGDESPAG